MAQMPETVLVRFASRTAVQRFQEALELLDEAIEDSPWNDTLRCVKHRLDEAWDGLSFTFAKE